ncbi:tabersonine 16-hydroxylase 2-like [Diospyros lotus]|uniref:tabersonine 16-hydroxylase 2-like n=1 Tax=Diospyros lotus TaxID=55363 RepID=UPI00224CDAB2|nr:tabersonine 16-hydroxylase 2-like [Diospyros lotus]
MDFQFQLPSIPFIFSFLLFVFVLAKTLKKRGTKTKSSLPPLPPGPPPLPLIGNMHQINGGLPHHKLRSLAKTYGPLMHLKLGEVSNIVVSSAEIAKEVLNNNGVIFAERPYLLLPVIVSYNNHGLVFCPYGDYWRQMRKIATVEILSQSRVQTFGTIREEEVMNLIRSVSADRESSTSVNLSRKIFSLTYGIVSRAAFGSKNKDQEAFIPLIEELVALVAGFTIVDMFPSVKLLEVVTGMRRRLNNLHMRIDRVLENILNEHKARNRIRDDGKREETEDLVDVLLRIQKHGDLEFPLTDDQIKAVILDIFGAGSETSSTTVEWAMAEMLRAPSVMERAQAEVREAFGEQGTVTEKGVHDLKYLSAVIKETMRLHPSAPLLVPRECSQDCVISGYRIPAKSKVVVNAWAIARDSKNWDDPEKFDPERFLDSKIDFKGRDFEYIPFGAGRRMCPGIAFAVPNIELPLAQLLYQFDWKLAGGMKPEELDMDESFALTVRRKNDLLLIPTPYNRNKN